MHTEQEAKKLWCPMARVIPARLTGTKMIPAPGVPTHNRVQEDDAPEATTHAAMNCLGTGCAMWRWKDELWQVRLKTVHYEEEDRFERELEPTPRPANVPENYVWHGGDCDGAAYWSEPDEEKAKRRTGYCGLAPILTIGPNPIT